MRKKTFRTIQIGAMLGVALASLVFAKGSQSSAAQGQATSVESLIPIALKHIAEQNKVKDVEPAGWVADKVPSTGATIYRIDGVEKGRPNGRIFSVIIDDHAQVVDLKTLSDKEKVEFFPPFPRPGAEAVNPEPKVSFSPPSTPPSSAVSVPVTITPNVNDLRLNPGQNLTEDIHVTVPAVPDPLFDVYFLADTTGSMGSVIDTVKAGATNIMNTLHGAFPNMAFGVGNYKDFANGDPYCFQHQSSPSVNPAQSQAAINNWSAVGGGDLPEGQIFALDQLATSAAIGWRPGARRIVVWFGDAPGHDPICNTFPGVPVAITEAIATADLKAAGIKVLAISTNAVEANGLNGTPETGSYPCANTGAAGQATRIAAATGGSYTSSVNAGTISTAIINAVTAATNIFQNVHLAASGGTAPFVTSIVPAAGFGPVDNKGHDYLFKITFTGPPCKNVDEVLKGAIDVIADGALVAQKKVTFTVIACERWSYGVKIVCGHVRATAPGTVPFTPHGTLRPGIYATEVNILNYHGEPISIHKYVYPLMRHGEANGREPRSVGREGQDAIYLRGKHATLDDCARLHEILHEPGGDNSPSIYFLEVVSPVKLTVTAVYTATDVCKESASLQVLQVEGMQIQK